MADPNISNPVQLDCFQEIVDCHFGPPKTAIEYLILDTRFWEPDKTTHNNEAYDPSGNPSNMIDEVIPPYHSGFFTRRTGHFVFDRSDFYTTDLDVVGFYNADGDPPPGVFIDGTKLDGTLSPAYPISFSMDGLVYSSLIGISDPFNANAAGGTYVDMTTGGAFVELPGAAGALYPSFFRDSAPVLTHYGVLPDGDLKYYTNAFNDVPMYKTVPVPWTSETVNETMAEPIRSVTFGLTVSYDGKDYEVIGYNGSGYYDGTSYPYYYRVFFLAKRKRTVTP